MWKWSSVALAICSVFLINTQEKVQAITINNGSLETGDFSNWKTTGQTTVEDSSFGVSPAAGIYQAVLETLQDTTGISSSDLESFLELSSNSLTSLGAVEGSAIKKIITVNAGDILSFNWNFLTDEVSASADYNDFAFLSISNINKLANTYDATKISFSRLAQQSGYQSYTYNFTQAGTYILGFGVVDVGDTTVNSALLVDNVRLTPVPEPTTMFGMLMGAGFSYAAKKRFSLQQKKN